MTDITTADQLALERGYQDWIDADAIVKAPLLARASDYITAHYRLRSDLTADETHRLDVATFLIANDLLGTPDVIALRAAQPIKKTDDKLGSLVTSVEYFDAPVDPYPTITAMLDPLLAVSAVNSGLDFYSGRQRV